MVHNSRKEKDRIPIDSELLLGGSAHGCEYAIRASRVETELRTPRRRVTKIGTETKANGIFGVTLYFLLFSNSNEFPHSGGTVCPLDRDRICSRDTRLLRHVHCSEPAGTIPSGTRSDMINAGVSLPLLLH